MELNTIELLFIMMCCGLFSWFIGYVLGTLTSLKIRMEELETKDEFIQVDQEYIKYAHLDPEDGLYVTASGIQRDVCCEDDCFPPCTKS